VRWILDRSLSMNWPKCKVVGREGNRCMMKKIVQTNEFYVALTIIVLSAVIGTQSSVFFTAGNMVDLLRSGIVTGIFVICAMIVIVSGGIDVSFPAIAVFSMFTTTKILHDMNYEGSVLLAFMIAGGIGLLLGLINAVFIAIFRLPTLIVTLGTSTLFSGFLLTFVGSREISNVPQGILVFSKMEIFSVTNGKGISSGLPASIYITMIIIVISAMMLKYTMLGRGIYAIGGDRTSAQRAGFNMMRIQFFIYTFVGFLSGIAGMIHTCMMRNSNPVDMLGSEMIVIAAVVLGGTRISGGH
jgi:simple sugar transport system permease protein